MVVRFYSSVAPETTLSGTINGSATSITVGSTSGFPALTPYTLALDYEGVTEELVQVNAAAGLVLDVTRAIDGTSAASHTAGARVRHVSSARDFADSRTHENSDENVHGLAPGEEIVGTDKVQTLTNKTLDSAGFTGSFTGTLRGSSAASSKLRLDNNTDVEITSTDHALQVGGDATNNIRMDGNEIMAVNNGVVTTLGLQSDGGSLGVNVNLPIDNVTNSITANGTIESNLLVVSRANGTLGNALNFKADADTAFRFITRVNGNMYWGPGGTAAQDVAMARTSNGTLTVDPNLQVLGTVTAANSTIPINNGPLTVTGVLKASNIKAGTAVTPSPGGSGGVSTVGVTYGANLGANPTVNVTVNTSVPPGPSGVQIQYYVDDVTATGFTIRCYRSTASATNFMWQAISST